MKTPRTKLFLKRLILGLLGLGLLGLGLLTGSCSLIGDFLNMDPVSVLAVSPPGNFVDIEVDQAPEVYLTFSAEMNRPRTEEAFMLKSDSAPVSGTFAWKGLGRTLLFLPLSPLERKKSYIISVSTLAEDLYGNSLEAPYTKTFHTRRETESPFVVSVSAPPESPKTIGVVFSEAMDEASVLSSFSLSPGAAGFFSFSDTRESFTFTPLADWITGKTYTATLGKTCLDREGNSLEEERTFQFRLPPVPELRLLSAATSTGYILQPAAEGGFVDPRLSIEKNEKFTFAFSRSVPPESRDSIIKFNPPVLFDSNWGAGGKTCDVTFPEHLHWGAVYEIRAAELLYRFLINGAGSVPLGVSGVAYISDTSVPLPVKEELLFAHNYGFSSSPSAAFEVLVTHGPGRLIVLGSFLEAFDLSASNGCMRVETLRVEIFPAETETLFRVHCEVENLSETGTLRISVDEKLRDDRENNLPASYALQVNKQ